MGASVELSVGAVVSEVGNWDHVERVVRGRMGVRRCGEMGVSVEVWCRKRRWGSDAVVRGQGK